MTKPSEAAEAEQQIIARHCKAIDLHLGDMIMELSNADMSFREAHVYVATHMLTTGLVMARDDLRIPDTAITRLVSTFHTETSKAG
jgi:hypothetical protein